MAGFAETAVIEAALKKDNSEVERLLETFLDGELREFIATLEDVQDSAVREQIDRMTKKNLAEK